MKIFVKRFFISSVCFIIVLLFVNYKNTSYYDTWDKENLSVYNLYNSNPVAATVERSQYLLGVNTHFINPSEQEINKLYESGLSIIRTDLQWSKIEKEKGVYDFTRFDNLVNILTKKGIRILFILDYGNPLYDNGLSPYTVDGRKAFANFAKEAVKRYKGKQIIWEIWNEPNGGFWKPGPNVNDYASLAIETSTAIKQIDSSAYVIAPALSEIHFSFLDSLGKLGVFKYIDAVSLHPYRRSNPETVIGEYDKVRQLINKYPHKNNIQLVSSEWGYPTAWEGMNDMKQAQYSIREYLTNIMCNVNLSIWYDWADDGNDKTNKEHTFGTVYRDLTPKPTYYAIKNMNETMAGYKFVKRIETSSIDDYVLMFQKDKRVCYAVWTTGTKHSVDIPVNKSAKVTVVEFFGKNYEGAAVNNTYKVDIENDVKYILY